MIKFRGWIRSFGGGWAKASSQATRESEDMELSYFFGNKKLAKTSVGMWSGLVDSLGQEIYDGDFVRVEGEGFSDLTLCKFGVNNYPAFDLYGVTQDSRWDNYHPEFNALTCTDWTMTVVGTAFREPELLKQLVVLDKGVWE